MPVANLGPNKMKQSLDRANVTCSGCIDPIPQLITTIQLSSQVAYTSTYSSLLRLSPIGFGPYAFVRITRGTIPYR